MTTAVATREQTYRETEDMVLALVHRDLTGETVSSEDLFWARIDIGMEYLRILHGDYKASTIWKKRSFWAWFRQAWQVNDKKILHELKESGITRLPWNAYIDSQYAQMMKWKINEKVL